MDSFAKLAFLHDDMGFETEESTAAAPDGFSPADRLSLAGTEECPGTSSAAPSGISAKAAGLPIHMAALPNGKRAPLLKSLLTSACERNCNYCPFRAGRDSRRVTFKPDELAQAVVQLSTAKVIQGAFISSGIAGGGLRTQDQLIEPPRSCAKRWATGVICTSS